MNFRSRTILYLLKSRGGLTGVVIILFLLILTVYGLVFVPHQTYSQWNNPNYWIDYPKTAAPVWMGAILGGSPFEHLILDENKANISTKVVNGIRTIVHTYTVNIQSDSFPDDFMFRYAIRYGSVQPVLQIEVERPDNLTFNVYYSGLPQTKGLNNTYSDRIFSTDELITQSLSQYTKLFQNSYPVDPAMIVFGMTSRNEVLKGEYRISEIFYMFDNTSIVESSGVTLGGTVFGILGTDDLRRDLGVGIVLGSPVALFIGLTVSTISVTIGLMYGVIAAFKGGKTDEAMMRINDIIYALPALPLLIIMSITFGRTNFLIAAFLIFFGWVGAAKIIRSMALQIKTFQYVDAARIMGQSDTKIIIKHIIPQLMPITFASMAFAVPAAIGAEAALSFLGLGDPSFPTWGQILHEANSADAAARGIWWWIVPPGLMIALTGLAFWLIGKSLDSSSNSLKNLVGEGR
jgi:peptide/nickel transport system permease protein